MRSREILPEEERVVFNDDYNHDSKTLEKALEALQIAESEIVSLIDEGKKHNDLKDKEIAELKEELQACSDVDFIRSNEYKDRLSEISALKEEVERLKERRHDIIYDSSQETLFEVKGKSSNECHHYFVQTDEHWKKCSHCGMLAPLFHQ